MTGILILWSTAAAAQAAPPVDGPRVGASWPVPWEPSQPTAAADRGYTQMAAMGRGMKGALAGAVLLGTTAAVIRGSMCDRRESCIGPTVLWGLMGATVGAVVGGLIAGATE